MSGSATTETDGVFFDTDQLATIALLETDLLNAGTSQNETYLGDASSLAYVNVAGILAVVTAGNDTDQLNDTASGGAGDDQMHGMGGDDVLDGGDGNDILYGGLGPIDAGALIEVQLTGLTTGGPSGNDSLLGGAGDDTIFGQDGSDTVLGGAGADNMQGGDGTDWLSYAGGTEGISVSLAETSGSGGDAAGDVYAGFENLIGSEGDDFLGGTAGANTIDGGAGDDTIAGGAGADAMNGGDGGGDWLDYSESSAGVTVDLAGGTGAGGDAEGDIFIDVENVLGSAADDSLIGGEGDNVIDGGAGNDTIVGSPGEDTLLGGEGIDLVDYSGGSGPVSINLDSGTAADGFGATDSISGIEQFVTGDSDDTVIAGAGDHDFDLGGGNNYYAWAPGDGNDTVRLGDGADTLDLQGWDSEENPWSTIDGGDGSTIFNNGSGGSVQVYGFNAADDFIACFAEGTMIATDRGEVPVESLRAGDLVLTMHATPRLMPLGWVGVSQLNLAHQRNKAAAAPILVRAGALMDGVPSRDLRLSPEHALFLDGMLVPARMLVNGETIVQEAWRRQVTYYHLEIEGHGLLVSDGALSESYVDDGNRGLFDNGTMAALSVDFEAYRANGRYAVQACAPVAAEGPVLRAIRQRLTERAGRAAQVA